MGLMSWTACYTAVDFRAKLRFPRAVYEPPRRLRFCGVFAFLSNQQLEGTKHMKPMFTIKNTNYQLIARI